jgi:hypothetical protein
VRNSGEAFADELPQQVVAYAARRMGPGSRIQLVRRLPLVCCHLIYASPGDGDGRVPRLMLGRWARPGWDRDAPAYTAARETILRLLRPHRCRLHLCWSARHRRRECANLETDGDRVACE